MSKPSTVIRYSLLTTWMLWNRLLNPPAHPLLLLVMRTLNANFITRWMTPLFGMLACGGFWIVLTQLRVSVVVIFLMAMVTVSSGWGVTWVARIGARIAQEREHGTYDPLCVSPAGPLGINWAVCAAVLNHNDSLGWVDLLRTLSSGLFLFILVVVLITTAFQETTLDWGQFARLGLDILALAAVSYVEHVQSIVLGSLIGMLAPINSRRRTEAQLWGVSAFLSAQLLTFLAAALAAMVIFPSLYQGMDAATTGISVTGLSLLVFYLLREVLIVILWRTLAYHLNANPVDFSFG